MAKDTPKIERFVRIVGGAAVLLYGEYGVCYKLDHYAQEDAALVHRLLEAFSDHRFQRDRSMSLRRRFHGQFHSTYPFS